MQRTATALWTLFLTVVLTTLACDVGDFLADPVPGAEATADAPPETLATTLLAQYDGDAALGAVFAALERGYSYPQLAGAIDGGTLREDGQIVAADGGLVAPAGPPAGIIDLSELESTLGSGRRARGGTAPQLVQYRRFPLQDLVAQYRNKHDGDTSHALLARVLQLAFYGYAVEQITDAILFGEMTLAPGSPNDGGPACVILLTGTGGVVPPSGAGQRQACVDLFADIRQATAAAATAPDVPEDAAPEGEAPAAVDEAGGDLEGYCRRYDAMMQDLENRADAISAAIGRCGENECDLGYLYRDAERAWRAHYEGMFRTAPDEILPDIRGLAASDFDGLLSGDGLPSVELGIAAVDAYTEQACGFSIGVSEE